MTRVQVSLYGDDAQWFQDVKQRIAERRDGNEPDNSEVVRLLMQDADL